MKKLKLSIMIGKALGLADLTVQIAGNVYNTGLHPIGIALDLLDFDKNTKVVFSKLDRALASGDAEDYAKIVLTAPDKPVVDIEINSTGKMERH